MYMYNIHRDEIMEQASTIQGLPLLIKPTLDSQLYSQQDDILHNIIILVTK